MRQTKAKQSKQLTEKQRRFIQAYMGKAQGNATEAARIAGYKKPMQQGSRLLTFVEVKKEIEARQVSSERRAILTREDRQELLSEIATTGGKDLGSRIKAMDVLNKMDGIYVQRHEIKAHLTMTPQDTEQAAIEMFRSNPDLWERVKGQVER